MDAIEICRSALMSAMPEVEVLTDMPPERPQRPTIQLSRTGGTETPWIDEPIITMLVWNKSDQSAYTLATDGAHVLAECAEDHPLLSSSNMLSMSRDEWTATGQARYAVQLKMVINKE